MSFDPELAKDCPKISAVHWKEPVTRIFPDESEEVERAVSELVPHFLFAQRRVPVEESFARKMSLDPELVKDCPKMSVLVHWKSPVTRTFPEGSKATE